jgi:predicted aspartyl protease
MLGDVQAARDQPDAAEHSYRTAITVSGPAVATAYARLGFLLYARGDDSGALPFLLEAKRRGANDSMLDFTLRAIRERTASRTITATVAERPRPDAQPAGEQPEQPEHTEQPMDAGVPAKSICFMPLARMHPKGGYLIDVEIDDAPGKLLIDTGATITVISTELLQKLGRSTESNSVRVLTANGPVNMPLARISHIAVGGRVAENTLVGVCETCGQGLSDGLLGLDLQAALGLELDLRNARARFADCASASPDRP